MAGKVETLVADSGAFIKGSPLEDWSTNLVTVKEVLAEVRDVHTRRRLQVLPYDLTLREPTQQSLHYVTNFAKKTGDFTGLSVVDLRILALTYQLECELGPHRGENIRKEPIIIQQASAGSKPPEIVGFYHGRNKQDAPDETLDDGTTGDQTLDIGSDSEDSVESGDEDTWITPNNYQTACEKMGGALETGLHGIAVGCVTTDYAMQNVLMQMGLNVISVEGLRVKQLRTYAMKCKACFKVTSNTGHVFCPHCGNKTLVKMVCVLNGDTGEVEYRALSQKQFSHKGLRHPLPLPKGGRHANNPILAPDQRETTKERRTRGGKVDPLHPDYIAQGSPFAMTDVNSRGAQVRFAQGRRGAPAKNGWRNNPNASKPKGRRK